MQPGPRAPATMQERLEAVGSGRVPRQNTGSKAHRARHREPANDTPRTRMHKTRWVDVRGLMLRGSYGDRSEGESHAARPCCTHKLRSRTFSNWQQSGTKSSHNRLSNALTCESKFAPRGCNSCNHHQQPSGLGVREIRASLCVTRDQT